MRVGFDLYLRPERLPNLRSALGVSTHSREPMLASGRSSKKKRAAPPFLIWTHAPQSSPRVCPVKRYEISSCRPGRCPTIATESRPS